MCECVNGCLCACMCICECVNVYLHQGVCECESVCAPPHSCLGELHSPNPALVLLALGTGNAADLPILGICVGAWVQVQGLFFQCTPDTVGQSMLGQNQEGMLFP